MAQKTLTTTQKKVLKDRDYAIKDIKQAEFGRKEIDLAEHEMPV